MKRIQASPLWPKKLRGTGEGSNGSDSLGLHQNIVSERSHHWIQPSSATQTPLLEVFPDGVEVFHDCPDATIDICFIHGLTGDRNTTWTATGQPTPWPKTLLPDKLDKARIITYGYDAYIVRRSIASSNRLIDHAANFLSDLATNRSSCHASSRPLVFVAHSLGGLVCKEAMLLSRNHPETHLRHIFESAKGIIFMGTPHKGSWMANWAKIPVSALGIVKSSNRSLLKLLETEDQLLESIQTRFTTMVREQRENGRHLEVTCFFEELPMPVAGLVVAKDSATLEGYTSISIHANHRDMVRFPSTDDNGFKRLLGELTRWNSPVDRVSSTAFAADLASERQKCLKSLAFPQMHGRSHDIDNAATGTCKWLLGHAAYTSWTASDRGLLWIKGKPGSGKSTLLKYVLDNSEEAFAGEGGALVMSFFFHGRGDQLQKTPFGLFRALLHQLLSAAPDVLSDLVNTFTRKCREIGDIDEKWQWHHEELRHFFETSLPKVLESRAVYLFVDALDECGKENAVRLVQHFKSLLNLVPPDGLQKLRVCVSCRHYPILDLDGVLEICLEHENGDDISTYVQTRILGYPEKTASRLQTLITDRADGVFLWACLVVNRALDLEREGESLVAIETDIRSIPDQLDDLYCELIQGMNSVSLKLVQWICFAVRPLSLDELRWAMLLDTDCPYRSFHQCHESEGYVANNDKMARRVKTVSRGLAEVASSSEVQFIHQSVKDFFLSKGLKALDSTSTSIAQAIGISHHRLSRICVRYMAMEEIGRSTTQDRKTIVSEFPFLSYATSSWVKHTKESETRGAPQEDLLEVLGWPSNALLELWTRLYRILEDHTYPFPLEGTNLVHVLSKFDITGLLTTVLEKMDEGSTEFDAKDQDGRTPLAVACEHGFETVTKLLLDKGAKTDSTTTSGRTPLSWAAAGSSETVVQMLLNHQASIDSRDKQDRTPLLHAIWNDRKSIVKLLIGNGASIESADHQGLTALSYAVCRDDGMVQTLLNKGANIESRDKYGRTSLVHAVRSYRQPVLVTQMLLKSGADINMADHQGLTALAHAIRWNRPTIADLLLNSGASARSLDEEVIGPYSRGSEFPEKPEERLGFFLSNLQFTAVLFPGFDSLSSCIYAAVDIQSGVVWTVKFLKNVNRDGSPLSRHQRRFLTDEIRHHYYCSAHPNIASLYKIVDEPDGLHIVMSDGLEGDLFHHITELGRYNGNDDLAKKIFIQILDAVEFCHSQGIYHRDLKPENFYVQDQGKTVKLTNFALATKSVMSEEFGYGSEAYMSPECCSGMKNKPETPYSPALNDIWSLGIILINLTCARNPWKIASTQDSSSYQAYTTSPGFLRTILPLSSELTTILERTLRPDPSERITIPELRASIIQCARLTDLHAMVSDNVVV